VFGIWLASGVIGLIGNYLSFKTSLGSDTIAGLAIIISVVIVGYTIYKLTKGLVPAVLWVSLVAMALTYPGMPYASEVSALTGKINFLALATPVIALAGLSIARDLPVFRQLGWRIVIVSMMANAGTFLGGAFVAQLFIKAPHM
jgi:hypothetical protein